MNELTLDTPIDYQTRISEVTVRCLDSGGREVGLTGGMISYGKTIKSCCEGYVRKTHGMMKRGHFKGAVKAEITIKIFSGLQHLQFETISPL